MNDISALSNWNTFKIKNMSQAFRSCDSLTSLNALSDWDTSSLTNMYYTFDYCSTLSDINGLSNVTNFDNTFNTCKNVTNMESLNGWDISSGTSFNRMCLLAKHPTFSRKGSWDNYGTFTPKKGLRF